MVNILFILLALMLCTAGSPAFAEVSAPGLELAPSGLERALAHLREREYRASWGEEGLQAPNRAQGFRSLFDRHGVRVRDREADAGPTLAISLARLGRGADLVSVAPAKEVASHAHRVELRRPGLVEWFVNSKAGLEQGFTIDARPGGEGPLVLELAVSGARASLRDSAIRLVTTRGALRYDKLVVTDASSRRVRASFRVPDGERLQIVIADADALYPLVVDPILTAEDAPTLQGNQEQAWFGYSAASAGDVNGDGYDDVIVGAPLYDAGESNEGAAFIFHGGPSGIAGGDVTDAATQLEGNKEAAIFGIGVAGAGDLDRDGYDDVIVGAHFYYESATGGIGRAFIFHGAPGGIPSGGPAQADAVLESDQAAIPAPQPTASPEFGFSVASAGDVNGDGHLDVLVGAPGYDSAGAVADAGAAFVFLGSPTGVASASAADAATRLEALNPGGWFGWRVASAGDVDADGYGDVIVGAKLYDNRKGAAFLFRGGPSGIAHSSELLADARFTNSQDATLGNSVAGAGDVDADGYDDVIIGCELWDDTTGGGHHQGAAVLFRGGPAGISGGDIGGADTWLKPAFGKTGAWFGRSVASAGDVNADGYDDVIVGAFKYSYGDFDSRGAAFVYHGRPDGIPSVRSDAADTQLLIEYRSGDFGEVVASAGDLNGDGFDDALIGAPVWESGETSEGGVFLYLGSPLPESGSAGALCGAAFVAWLAHRRRHSRG